MPAIFTFIAGFTIYLFSKEDTKEGFFNRVLTVIIIGAFSLWLIIGTEVGIKRRLNDEYLELHDNEVRSPESLEKKLEEMDFEELKKEFNGKSEEE